MTPLRFRSGRPPGLRCALVLCLVAAAAVMWAQPDSLAPTPEEFDTWQEEQGLPDSSVTSLAQTPDGYLWLGTFNGLVRFDGVRLTVFKPGNTPGLSDARILALAVDTDGSLWAGHETGGLTRLHRGRVETVPLPPSWSGVPLIGIARDDSGDLWVLNENGALRRLRDGWESAPEERPGYTGPTSLARDKDGRLWVTRRGTVSVVERGQVTPQWFDDPAHEGDYHRVFTARGGGVWVTTSDGLRLWRDQRWQPARADGAWRLLDITALAETRDGSLWVGTLGSGLACVTARGELKRYTQTTGLPRDWVRALQEDHEGNLWIGTGGGGLAVLRRREVTWVRSPDAWQGAKVLGFHATTRGTAWIGTEGAGLYQLTPAGWSHYGTAAGVSNLYVWSVLDDGHGTVWAGTWGGGLFAGRDGHFTAVTNLPPQVTRITALQPSRAGGLWIGSSAGAYHWKDGRVTAACGPDVLPLPDVRSLAETPDGTLWLGTLGGGAARVRDGRVTLFRGTNGLGSDFVVCVLADPDGTVWFGTQDEGLRRWRNGVFSAVTRRHGLPDAGIGQLLDDGAGHLWLGTDQGVLRVDRTALNACADGTAETLHVTRFGGTDRERRAACSGGFQPGAARLADGTLWFSATKGIAVVNPAASQPNPLPPPVLIETIIVDGRPFTPVPGFPLELPAGSRGLDLQYTALSFTAPDRMQFRYRLVGLESEWIDAGTRRMAVYSHLAPGAYRFEVMAANNSGLWNPVPATLTLRLLPHWWQTWWSRTLALAAGGLAVVGLALLATRRRHRRELALLDQQRALEKERARIARDLHDDLGASLTRITMLSDAAPGDIAENAQALERIHHLARQLTRAMDEVVWAVDPRHDTLDSLANYLGRYAHDFLNAARLRCRLDIPAQLPAVILPSSTRHNVFLAFKETLHNAVKHAGASEVRITLTPAPGRFELTITDNGRGFEPGALGPDPARLVSGHGLANIRRRLEDAHGTATWDSAPGQGTTVRLTVHLP